MKTENYSRLLGKLKLFLTGPFWCLLFQFKTKGGSQLKEYCTSLTKEDCRRQSNSLLACEKVSKKYGLLVVFTRTVHTYDHKFLIPEISSACLLIISFMLYNFNLDDTLIHLVKA